VRIERSRAAIPIRPLTLQAPTIKCQIFCYNCLEMGIPTVKENRVLFAWLGNTDVQSSEKKSGLGPIACAVADRKPSRVVVLSAQPEKADTKRYERWLRSKTDADLIVEQTDITDPWDFRRIYHASAEAVEKQRRESPNQKTFIFDLSPGTGAMSAAWIILAKTRFAAELIESSVEDKTTGTYPVRTVNLPFELSIELIGDLLRKPGNDLIGLSEALPPAHSDFSKIIHKSQKMERVILLARQWALYDVPVLILGESGTGKELLARAIYAASGRASKPFKTVNCGAIVPTLLESELFGHAKGAFTGATKDRAGVFQQADGGTIFLDEIGELPPTAQVALLRILQEKVVTPVGGDKDIHVDVRVIAATNRDLAASAYRDNSFRIDLFHRLAVGLLKVPPLRQRSEDIDLLTDWLLKSLPNTPGTSFARSVSPSGRRRLREHDWPGNVRELQNALTRAALSPYHETITKGPFKNNMNNWMTN